MGRFRSPLLLMHQNHTTKAGPGIALIVLAILALTIPDATAAAEPLTRERTSVGDSQVSQQSEVASFDTGEFAYVVSWMMHTDPYGPETGKVRVVNLGTGEIVHTLETGYQPDIAISPDGRRLYLAAIEFRTTAGEVWRGYPTQERSKDPKDRAGEDYLTAFDTTTWQILWQTRIMTPPGTNGRVIYNDGGGASALTLTPDGMQLMLQKYAGRTSWFDVIDTATGQVVDTSPRIQYCGAGEKTFAPDGQWLYVNCGYNNLRFMQASTLEVTEPLAIPGVAFATMPGIPPYTPMVLPGGRIPGLVTNLLRSPDGHWLYAITTDAKVAVVDVQKRSIATWADLRDPNVSYAAIRFGNAALSHDGSRLFLAPRHQMKEGPPLIHVFNRGSWELVDELRLDNVEGNIGRVQASKMSDKLLFYSSEWYLRDGWLYADSYFYGLDFSAGGTVLEYNLDLQEEEWLVRLVIGAGPNAIITDNESNLAGRVQAPQRRPDRLP